MPVTLYDPKTGEPVRLPPEEAQKAATAGTLGPQRDQLVHIVLADGRKGTVPGHELAENLANGAKLYDHEAEAHDAEVEAEDTPKGFAKAVGLSTLEGATAGLSTGLIRKGVQTFGTPEAAKRFQHGVEVNREQWPITHIAGNVAGAAGVALASGGLSAGGGAGVLSRVVPAAGIDAIGGAVGRGVARTVAGIGGEGLAATAGRTAAEHAARAGVEGALYAAGTHVGEDMLGDVPTAADKLFVATAKGWAFGLGLGGVLGAGGSVVRGLRGRSAAAIGGGSLLEEAATEATTAAEAKLAAAEAAHADATKRSFSWGDMQGQPLKGDLYRAGAGGLDDFTTPMESEPAFDLKTRRSINLGPSEGDAAYKNPYTTDAIIDTYDKKGQLVRPKAPKGIKAFDIGSMAPQVDPMSAGTRFSSADQWEGPLKFDKNVVGLKQGLDGLDGLQPTKTGSPMHVSTNSETISANEKLRRGTLGEAHMPQTNADAAFSTASDAAEGRPFGVAQEDPAIAARRVAADADLATARKDYAKSTQEIEEAADLRRLAAEVKAGDPHKMADRLRWQSTGADAGITKRVNKFHGGIDRAGATMGRYGIIDMGGEDSGVIKATLSSLSENTPEKMLERTTTKVSQLVEEIEMQAIGGTKASATLGELLAPLDAQIAKLEQVSTTVPIANQLRAQRQMLLGTPKFRNLLDVDGNLVAGAEKSPVSLSDIIAERRGVNRKAYAVGDVHANIIKESNAALGQAWDELEQKALNTVEEGLGGKFKALKTDITDLINVEKALEGKVARASSARAFGVLPHMAGMAGASIGGAILPVGGHLVGHAIGAMLSKSIMDRGNAAAAVALTKISDIGAVRHLMGLVDKRIAGAAKGLTTASEVKAGGVKLRVVGGSASGHEKREPIGVRYRDAIKQLDAMESQGSALHEKSMQATQDLAQHAPNVAAAYSVNMARAVAFLSSKRPQALLPNNPYTNQEPSVLDTDKLAFVRSCNAATNPMEVLSRFEKGVITPEDTEALKATAPEVYRELQEKTMSEVAARAAAGKPMPFKQRMALGLLFDTPTDPCLDPQNYKMLQANVFTPPAPVQPPSGGGKSNAPRRPVKLPGLGASPLDQLANKGPGRK